MFEAGVHYRIDYPTTDLRVAGCGLLALRDATTYLRGQGAPRGVYGLGVSQTGRLLRQMMAEGFHLDDDSSVFDGLLVVIAGAKTGMFNRVRAPTTQR
ncbi:MAG: hypothetical protein GY698_01655 [Actinomycetia bacterium]|nr:hypothetical protein [Actinomycetes bacterium]